jgi:hypothetical protein
LDDDNSTVEATQPVANKATQYPSLSKSKALLALLQLARSDGQNHKALRLLLILLNAHFKLTAHYRIFENLTLILNTNPVNEFLAANPQEAQHFSTLKHLCQWVISNKIRIAQQPALAEFDYDDPNVNLGSAPHPLNRNHNGFTRNSVCSALFNRHESVANYNVVPMVGTPAYQ